MKDALLTNVLTTLLLWLVIWGVVSAVAGAVLSRVLGRLRREDAPECVPVEQWSPEAVDSLYTAISEPEFIESVLGDLAALEVYEGEERV